MPPLQILFQDEYLVAVDKPAGMIVHPGREPEDKEHIAMKVLRDQIGKRVHLAHRLDRPTSGVLLFALDKKTAGLAQQAFELRKVSKTYLAIVPGCTPLEWKCETPLAPNPDAEALPASTTFERLEITDTASFPQDPKLRLSLIKANPHTGRFHQIRRHLLEADFPIVGDFRYSGIDRSLELGEIVGNGTRMLLQSKSLRLTHPHTHQPLEITAPADPEFLKIFPDII